MRNVPLRRRLFLLAAAAILPLAIMSGLGLLALAKQQRAQAERASLELSRALATAVDAELRRSSSVLEALAITPFETEGAEEYYQLAQSILATQTQWQAFILAEPDARVLLNTRLPLGSKLFPIAEKESFETVVRTRKPVVGSIARGPRGDWGVPVRVPVVRDGDLRFVLTGVVKPQAILEVINRQRVPKDWVVSVFDAKGMRVARSRRHDEFIGKPAAPGLQELMATGAEEGTGLTDALEGDLVHTAYSRLRDSGWAVAIGIPAATVEAGVYRSLAAFGGGIVLSLMLGALAALAVARSINRPMAALRMAAQSLGRDEPPILPASDIREIQEVADALGASAERHARGDAERADLMSAELRVRTAAEDARRRLELLASAGAVLSRSLEPHATLQAIAEIVVPGIADWCRVDLLDADGTLQRALTYHCDPDKARMGTELVARLRAAPGAVGSMAWVVATGQSHLAHFEPVREFDQIRDRDLLSFANAIGMRAYFIVPLIARGRTLGALAALQAESGRTLGEDDCALITELAQRAALALDNARLYGNAEAALQQAETANRAKDEFLAMLGHELRNPLAPIVTALHLMKMRNDGTAASERGIIERQVAHLSRLVDDLLDVSRITSGKIQLERELVDMKAVVARALELTQPMLERRARPVEVEQPEGPVYVIGDAVRLTQVLCNLLTNAAKFTPGDGSIELRLRSGKGQVEIVVEDSGSGITPRLLPHVFDLFMQGAQPMDRQAGGLGLGLAIVKTLVHMHDGEVSAVSEGAGRGSTFVVRLPSAEGTEPIGGGEFKAPQTARGSGRILIVDDNADAAETLASLLQATGYEVRIAADGAAALAMTGTFIPELAVLDIGLPGMDGYELAQRLRAGLRGSGLRLIALTGYGREPDRLRALEATFDEHLVKPVSAQRLIDVVARLLGKRPQFVEKEDS